MKGLINLSWLFVGFLQTKDEENVTRMLKESTIKVMVKSEKKIY